MRWIAGRFQLLDVDSIVRCSLCLRGAIVRQSVWLEMAWEAMAVCRRCGRMSAHLSFPHSCLARRRRTRLQPHTANMNKAPILAWLALALSCIPSARGELREFVADVGNVFTPMGEYLQLMLSRSWPYLEINDLYAK